MEVLTDKVLLERIDALSPTSFENLTLDLLRAVGFRNVVWRTPGADGGRDIQAEQIETDLSGVDRSYVWYVECKRYTKSVDWPTLWNKIAYADSHRADFLLLVTNSQPSPQCENEVTNWNKQRRRPEIRVWRGYDLPKYLRLHESVALAHGIMNHDVASISVTSGVTGLLVSLVQASYGALVFGAFPEKELVAAATLSELLHQRMHGLAVYGRFVAGGRLENVSDWRWLSIDGDISDLEEVGFRAVVASVRHVLQAEGVRCRIADRRVELEASSAKREFDSETHTFLRPVLLLSMCDSFAVVSATTVVFELRS